MENKLGIFDNFTIWIDICEFEKPFNSLGTIFFISLQLVLHYDKLRNPYK